jgi:hypothetical protein
VPKFGYPRAAALLYHYSKPNWIALQDVMEVVEDICLGSERDVAELGAAMDDIDRKHYSAG